MNRLRHEEKKKKNRTQTPQLPHAFVFRRKRDNFDGLPTLHAICAPTTKSVTIVLRNLSNMVTRSISIKVFKEINVDIRQANDCNIS